MATFKKFNKDKRPKRNTQSLLFKRKRFCRFTVTGVEEIDYKDIDTLRDFIVPAMNALIKVWQTTGAARHLEGVELQAPRRGPGPALQLPQQPQRGPFRGLPGHGHAQPIEQAHGPSHLEAQQQASIGGPSFQACQAGHGTKGARPKGTGPNGSARSTAPTGKGP